MTEEEKKKQLEYYIKNNKIQDERFKRYTVKVPKHDAEIFDELLKENGDKFSDVAKKAIERYIINHKKK